MLRQAATDYAAKSSFITPEVAALAPATLDAWLDQEPGLKIYAFPLRDIRRSKQHRLSTPEERAARRSRPAGQCARRPPTDSSPTPNCPSPS